MFSTHNRKNNVWMKHLIPSYKWVGARQSNESKKANERKLTKGSRQRQMSLELIERYKQVYAELLEFMKDVTSRTRNIDNGYVFTDWDQISICERFYFDKRGKEHRHNFRLMGEGYYPVVGCSDCGHCDGSHLFTAVVIEFNDYDHVKRAYVTLYNTYMDTMDMNADPHDVQGMGNLAVSFTTDELKKLKNVIPTLREMVTHKN